MLHQFEITPKMERRVNGTLLTPRMKIFVSSKYLDPFANGAEEVIDEYEDQLVDKYNDVPLCQVDCTFEYYKH